MTRGRCRSDAELEGVLGLRARGLTVRQIAVRLGIPRGTISEWLYRRRPQRPRSGMPECASCGNPHLSLEGLPPAYAYLLGLYLGDGSIATHPRAYKLRLSLDAAYPAIIGEAFSAIQQVAPFNKVNCVLRPTNVVEVYAFSKSWPCLFPQHGPGKKHHRKIELTDWQQRFVRRAPQLLLRGLIHSDGCRFINTGRAGWRHPRYSFTNLSADIRGIFTDACDLVGVRWTSAPQVIYVSRKADVATLDSFIGPKT